MKKAVFFLIIFFALFARQQSEAQSCTGLGSQEFSDIVFVTVSGTPTSAGTADDPVDLLTGLTMVGGNTDKVYIQSGTYVLSQELIIPSNVQLVWWIQC